MSTRFFVTVNDSVNTVITAMNTMKGGEIFIPKTINSIKIYDLANSLKSYFKNSKSKIDIIGLREGEKIHEKIITQTELTNLKKFKSIYIIDTFNRHKLPKMNKIMKYFESDKAKILSRKEILSYLTKNNLLSY